MARAPVHHRQMTLHRFPTAFRTLAARFTGLTPGLLPCLGLLLCLAALARPAMAQEPTPTLPHVAIETSQGTITLVLEGERAPATTENFLRYVDARKLDGTTFYRAMHLDWGTPPNGLVQGGIGNDPARALPPVVHEPTSETGVLHKTGAISMARYAPGSAQADFSIMVSDQPGLDADPEAADADARAGFAAFGHVVEGMDVVLAIFDAPRSPTKGEGFMRGQMLEQPVRILTVRRVPAPAVQQADREEH